ncbi:MAG TPA: biotin/lipoyl-containing protein, partial [Geodermatophilus sp.]|nr:biotin/lipoyl-containing protein [Geodermatophilus sp.]
SAEQDAALRDSAIALVRAAGYVGAGTVEFLYQPQERLTTFLEVNTRLQVEHPVTEATTGLDLVKLQLHVAAGGRLEGDPPPTNGHAVEARLTAEDAESGFAPAPGRVELLRLPTGPGIRVDTGLGVGDAVPPQYDSMIAKVIAWGRDRPEALARLRCALRETTVVLRGGATTKSFLLDLLDRPEVVEGTADTGWLDRAGLAEMVVDRSRDDGTAWVALVQVAVDIAAAEERRERQAFLASARGGRPRAPHEVGRTVELGMRGQVHRLTVSTLDRDRHRVELDGRSVDVEVDRLGPLETRLTAAGQRWSVVAVEAPGSTLVEVDGATHRVGRDVGGVVRAPAPAVVVAVRAAPGDDVEAGQPVAVLESMKMETAVRAPFAGRVREVRAVVNSQVDAGAPLMLLDRTGGDAEEALGERVALPGGDDKPDDDPRARATALLGQLRALVTGYDVGAGHARRLVTEYAAARDELPSDDGPLLSAELDVLVTFAAIAELSRNRPASEEEEADVQVHSPREHFHTYLHSLDVEREGLPETFRARLQRALAHYGVSDLEPGPALEEAVHRVFLAQQRIAEQLPAVSALLDRWLTTDRLPEGPSRTEVGEVLDRLVPATQLRHPALGDLVRAVRFRHFEEPVVRAARQEVLDRAERLLEQLDEAGARGDTAESIQRMEALVASPEPLVRLLASRLSRPTSVPDPVLEVLTRRYYRSRNLEGVTSTLLDGDTCVTADYTLGEDRLHLVALMTRATRLEPALAAVAGAVDGPADPAQTVVDLYVDWPDRPADADALSDSLRGLVERVPVLRTTRRVTVTACSPDGDVETLTFRPGEDGRPAEERLLRGLHPLTARRLDLWRLEAFDAERVPSPEDTHLLHVTAKDHPNDERFIALAEVRDLTPVRDERGEVVGFPTIERQLMSCLDGLRRAQSLRRSRRPLTHNRIHLYAWPSIEVPLAEVAEFARTAAPLTLGAGLDQIVLLARLQEEGDGPPRDVALRFSNRPDTGERMTVTDRPTSPRRPLDDYSEKVLSARARGAPYPYELSTLLAGPDGSFTEH